MMQLELKEKLNIKELLKIAYEYGNGHADIPSHQSEVDSSFEIFYNENKNLINKLEFEVGRK